MPSIPRVVADPTARQTSTGPTVPAIATGQRGTTVTDVYEQADDIKDVTEKTAGTLQGLLGAHRPTGHDVTITAKPAIEPAIETPPLQPLDAGSIGTAGLVAVVLADGAIHWAREWLRRPKG